MLINIFYALQSLTPKMGKNVVYNMLYIINNGIIWYSVFDFYTTFLPKFILIMVQTKWVSWSVLMLKVRLTWSYHSIDTL